MAIKMFSLPNLRSKFVIKVIFEVLKVKKIDLTSENEFFSKNSSLIILTFNDENK